MKRSTPIEVELLSFVRDIVEREQIDVIVCGERKGSAVMRALIEALPEKRLDWPWDRVVSTVAVNEFDWSAFPIKRVLAFDELVYRGGTLQRAKSDLKRLLPSGEILTAGFAVWSSCGFRPDFS